MIEERKFPSARRIDALLLSEAKDPKELWAIIINKVTKDTLDGVHAETDKTGVGPVAYEISVTAIYEAPE